MSFFGFGAKLPDGADAIDFQDTYEGLGEQLNDNDAFNDETFGTNVNEIGKDFSFGNQTAPAHKIDPSVSYAQAAKSGVDVVAAPEEDDSLKPMDSLWGTAPAQQGIEQQQQQPSKKVLSLEELEANLSSSKPSGDFQQQPPQHMLPPQNMFAPPFGYGAPVPPGFNIPPNQNGPYVNYPNGPGFPGPPGPHMIPGPGGFPPIPNGPPQNNQNFMLPPQGQPQIFNQQQQQQQHPEQPPQGPQQQQPLHEQQPFPQTPSQDSAQKYNQKSKELDLSQFPVLGSTPAVPQQQPQQPQQQPQQQSNNRNNDHRHHGHKYDNNYRKFNHYNNNNVGGDNKQLPASLTPEEEEKFNIKAKKLERIIKFNNIMTPRDKDFVTRFQISQIVTEDPYNEDFYFQIFKAIRSQNTHDNGSLNSIAQYYLEHSGHRLGGKHKRADVALQRMQQQVTKAVTVAKERPKNSQYIKEGSLGKISFGSGKTPRKQLEVFKKEIEANAENVEGSPVVNKLFVNFDQKDSSSFKLSNKTILNCLEKTFAVVLKLEAQEKHHEELNVDELWESLYISNETVGENGERISGQIDELKENIFISYFNFDKGIKLFPRILRYLTNDQKLKLIENIFKKVSLLKLLNESSYDYYYTQDEASRSKIDKRVELFTNLILKFIIAFISNELKFNEIVRLIINMINYNSLVKLLPNKIGLTLITILISKIELIKQDISIMSSDLIIWSNVYDKLFNNMISKLINVFPKELYTNDDVSLVKEYGADKTTVVKTNVFDDSYIWHFLASLALAGKLQHQRIIVDEVREKVFECVEFAKKLGEDESLKDESIKKLTNLNLFLNVMGLNASDSGDITELK